METCGAVAVTFAVTKQGLRELPADALRDPLGRNCADCTYCQRPDLQVLQLMRGSGQVLPVGELKA